MHLLLKFDLCPRAAATCTCLLRTTLHYDYVGTVRGEEYRNKLLGATPAAPKYTMVHLPFLRQCNRHAGRRRPCSMQEDHQPCSSRSLPCRVLPLLSFFLFASPLAGAGGIGTLLPSGRRKFPLFHVRRSELLLMLELEAQCPYRYMSLFLAFALFASRPSPLDTTKHL